MQPVSSSASAQAHIAAAKDCSSEAKSKVVSASTSFDEAVRQLFDFREDMYEEALGNAASTRRPIIAVFAGEHTPGSVELVTRTIADAREKYRFDAVYLFVDLEAMRGSQCQLGTYVRENRIHIAFSIMFFVNRSKNGATLACNPVICQWGPFQAGSLAGHLVRTPEQAWQKMRMPSAISSMHAVVGVRRYDPGMQQVPSYLFDAWSGRTYATVCDTDAMHVPDPEGGEILPDDLDRLTRMLKEGHAQTRLCAARRILQLQAEQSDARDIALRYLVGLILEGRTEKFSRREANEAVAVALSRRNAIAVRLSDRKFFRIQKEDYGILLEDASECFFSLNDGSLERHLKNERFEGGASLQVQYGKIVATYKPSSSIVMREVEVYNCVVNEMKYYVKDGAAPYFCARMKDKFGRLIHRYRFRIPTENGSYRILEADGFMTMSDRGEYRYMRTDGYNEYQDMESESVEVWFSEIPAK